MLSLDAEANIRDNQGEVSDYANYFRNTETTAEGASSRGLLARDKGRKGFAIESGASDDLYALYVAGKITAEKAVAIAEGAPSHVEKQALGIRYAENHPADAVVQYMKSLSENHHRPRRMACWTVWIPMRVRHRGGRRRPGLCVDGGVAQRQSGGSGQQHSPPPGRCGQA